VVQAAAKEYQQILVEECDKAGEETSRRIFKLEDEVERDLKKRGMTVVEDVDLKAFRQAGEKAYEVLKIQDAKTRYREIIQKVALTNARPASRDEAYARLCAVEGLPRFLLLMVALIFLGGVARTLGAPLNWTTDAATCLFAWACFLCADIAWRRNSLMAITLARRRLPPAVRKACDLASHFIICAVPAAVRDRVRHLACLDEPGAELPGHSG
jgi:hypothetical protein